MRAIAFVLLVSLFSGSSLRAQSEADFEFYHGIGGTSRVSVDNDGNTVLNHRAKFELTLRPGEEVCISIANAHPVNYRYSLDAVVDTTRPEFPDVSKIATFLTGLPGYVAKDKAGQEAARGLIQQPRFRDAASPPVIDTRLDDLIAALSLLKRQVDSAQAAADASDAPESFDQRSGSQGGFRGAVAIINSMSKDDWNFNDPKLESRYADELKKARDWAAADNNRRVVVDAVAASSSLLIAARNKIRSDYATSVPASPRLCKAIAQGRNRIRLAVAKAGTAGSRDTFVKDDKTPALVEINVESRYQRKVASLDPLTFAVFSREVPVFSIRNDTLRVDRISDPTNVRPGVMLSLNPWAIGAAENWIVGFGFGVGYSTKDVISDLVVGTTLSYQNLIRVGIGVGKSSQPESVKGAVVGQKIPSDFGALKDAVQTGQLNSRSWYILMTIPGLSIGK